MPSSDQRGLSSAAVLASRTRHGANVLTPPAKTPGWRLYLAKFDDPVIRILMIAAAIAIAVGAVDGHVAEGIGILVAIALATFLAYWNERRAEKAFDVLNTSRDDQPVKVIRDGGYTVVAKRDVVVGDIAFVETGEEIPADGTLVDSVGLLIDESKLTGESLPAARATGDKLLRGTIVADGHGLLMIAAVGDATEIGKTLVESVAEADDDSPLQKQLAKLSRVIGVVGFGVASITFVALFARGLLTGALALSPPEWFFLGAVAVGSAVAFVNVWLPIAFDAIALFGSPVEPPGWLGGRAWLASGAFGVLIFFALVGIGLLGDWLPTSPLDWLDRSDLKAVLRDFMIAVTIVVVAVPEGLAMSVTLSLAYSMRTMTANQTLVRRMDATETIGAATVICSDKTGTLTQNRMTVAAVRFGDDERLPDEEPRRARIVAAVAVNGTAQLSFDGDSPSPLGNPTEAAMLAWLHELGIDYRTVRAAEPVVAQWGFNTDRKFMATLGRRFFVKGAPDVVLARCTAVAVWHGDRPLTSDDADAWRRTIREFAARGMRLIALADGSAAPPGELDVHARDLTWLGIVAIADPVRPAVPAAIAACRRAGVAVKVVTGDSPETAAEIARQIGLDPGTPMTGPEFAAAADAALAERVESLTVLARARPVDKLRLVNLLKSRGEVVAVTGDGVNDGPALNHADVGLAMGKSGTAVAREAADIILLDDSFPSIVTAVKWGRALYENIQRFILFQLTINVAALGLAVVGPFLGFDLPLTVMQMLWINLIMDTLAALALATEPPHDGVLARPPRRPDAFIVTPAMARGIFGVGAVVLVALLGIILIFRGNGMLTDDDEPSRGSTVLFTVFVLLQWWNLFNAKAFGRGGSVLPTLGNNPSFLAIAAAILIGQVLLVQFGGAIVRTVPLSPGEWLMLLVATSVVLVAGEGFRFATSRRRLRSGS